MLRFEISEIDPIAHREELASLLGQFLTTTSSGRRCQWFYEDNPHGRAIVLQLREAASGAVVGSGAVVPRQLLVDGEPRMASVMADFWVHPAHRSLGPAVQLQRACIERARAIGMAFYDLPQGNMAAVYRRLKLLGDASLSRYVRPIRLTPFVRNRISNASLARAIGSVGDLYLRLADAARRTPAGCEVSKFDGAFGVEFDELLGRRRPATSVQVARSSGYLQWRYREHYLLDYNVYVAREGGRLVGYAVTVAAGEYVELADLFPIDEPRIVANLLLGVARAARSTNAAALAASFVPDGPAMAALVEAGFRQRESRPFVIQEFDPTEGSRSWRLSYGDVDY